VRFVGPVPLFLTQQKYEFNERALEKLYGDGSENIASERTQRLAEPGGASISVASMNMRVPQKESQATADIHARDAMGRDLTKVRGAARSHTLVLTLCIRLPERRIAHHIHVLVWLPVCPALLFCFVFFAVEASV
jgi:hypothetical protein